MPGPGDEITNRSRHQHLVGLGDRGHTRADVDGDPGHVVAPPRHLTRVQPAPHLEPVAGKRIPDMPRTADRSGRAVERREEPVTGGARQIPGVQSETLANRAVEEVEGPPPAFVAELAGPLRGADDVHEQHRGQYAIRIADLASRAGDELLDGAEQLGIRKRPVVGAVELHEPRARDVLGEIAAVAARMYMLSRLVTTSVGTATSGSTCRRSSS